MTTQIGKCKRVKKIDTPFTPSNVTNNDSTSIFTPMDVYKSLYFSQQVRLMIQQATGPSTLLVQALLENTFVLRLI